MTEMSRRARALSGSFFNRDKSGSAPGSPSAAKPLAYEVHNSSSPAHTTPPNEIPQPVPSRRTSRAGLSRPSSVLLMMNGQTNGVQRDDDIPLELVRIFRYLTLHSQKLYYEGFFHKLDDMNPDGSPANPLNKNWVFCQCQLLGTVLHITDKEAADQERERRNRGYPPSENGGPKPTFLNLTDASMKMIWKLPQKDDRQALENVLSISTAGRNRYLLHFEDPEEMVKWTAAIRLAMFEHSSLQEAYTGALIAAKGPKLNSIGTILTPSKFKVEDWTRIRFGAGTPWKKYWTVITPPDEKAVQKRKKAMKKATKQMGAQAHLPPVLGEIKFYDTDKVKKKTPVVATISGAYAAYAVYPEARAMIDHSTLIKIEGQITINSSPPFTSEGIIFMMPELHASVSGFEMMLRFIMPTYDVFGLYGRPDKLVADSIDPRSLMFAFPKDSRSYNLLDISHVIPFVQEPNSTSFTEAEWRKKLKQMTSKVALSGGHKAFNQSTASLPAQTKTGSAISFNDEPRRSFLSQRPPLQTIESYQAPNGAEFIEHSHSAPPELTRQTSHTRSLSESQTNQGYGGQIYELGPPGQALGQPPAGYISPQNTGYQSPPPGPQGYPPQGPQGYPPQGPPPQGPLPPGPHGMYGPGSNSRPPSSRSQRSQGSQNSGYEGGRPPQQRPYGSAGGPGGYRQPGPPGSQGQMQGPPSAYRGDHRGAGGFDPSLGGRQAPPLRTDGGQMYSGPAGRNSPTKGRPPPGAFIAGAGVANRRNSREMMHSNNAGPINQDYYSDVPHGQQGAAQLGPGPHRALSHGSSESADSEDLAPPRAGFVQGHRQTGSTSTITPNTSAIASRIPGSNNIHNDPEDFNLADELERKRMEAAAAASRGPVYPQPQPYDGYQGQRGYQGGYPPQQYQQEGSARSVRGYNQ